MFVLPAEKQLTDQLLLGGTALLGKPKEQQKAELLPSSKAPAVEKQQMAERLPSSKVPAVNTEKQQMA